MFLSMSRLKTTFKQKYVELQIGRTHSLLFFFLLLLTIQVTNKIMFVIFTCMALVTTLSLVGYLIFEAEYDEKLYYLCYGIEESPVLLFR